MVMLLGTVGIGVISYGGKEGTVCVSVVADRVSGSEGTARRLCSAFDRRFDLYLRCANTVLKAE
jgi:hypothetical protein